MIAKFKTITKNITYQQSALEIYNAIPNKKNTLLLESAEITTKNNTQSLLLASSAVRIEATSATTVVATALTDNGLAVLRHLNKTLSVFLESNDDKSSAFLFSKPDLSLEEVSRIKSPNVLQVLRSLKDDFISDTNDIFVAGIFGFDLLEAVEDLPPVNYDKNTCPAYVFYIAETLMKSNHMDKTCEIIGFVFGNDNTKVNIALSELENIPALPIIKNINFENKEIKLNVNISDKKFRSMVNTCKDYITAGDAFQIVPSRVFSMPCKNPLSAYSNLKEINPSPYMFYINDQDFTIFGASPESALKYTKSNNIVSLYPIAGTRSRGKNINGSINFDLDSKLELDLRLDTKEVSEHIMLVDLARNDIARISKPATRNVSALMQIDKYSHVQHLVSEVQGQLRDDYDCLHAYQACMNMGTLTGAPKVRTSQIIRELECIKRGSYGGAVGYINSSGDMDSCITIRSAFVKDGVAYIGAGAGVVLESDPQAEANETRLKAMSVITAIANSHGYTLNSEEN